MYLHTPDTGAVVEGRVDLPHVPNVTHVPHVHTVVIVHTGQVPCHWVKGERQGVWVLGLLFGREQVPVEVNRQYERTR